MPKEHPYDRFREKVAPALLSKVEEFHVLGYDQVTMDELWAYLVKKPWRRPKEEIRIYEIVANIMSVKIGEYMNYATVEAFKEPSPFESTNPFGISEEERRALFGEDLV